MGDVERPSSSSQEEEMCSSVAVEPPLVSAARGNNEPASRRVMVVAEPTRESMGALEWALSHALLEKDQILLLHVVNSGSWRNSISALLRRNPSGLSAPVGAPAAGGGEERAVDFLEAMRSACEAKQPKMKVSVEAVEMDVKEGKGPTILAQSVAHAIDMLVIGQRRNNFLACRLSGSYRAVDTAEYCIENSKCLCVGVQKKGQNAGYLLNTKKHKNYWHLA